MEYSGASGRAPRALAIDPARGPLLAAGGILLATGVTMTDTRLDTSWSNGVHLIVAAATFAFLFGLALLSPLAERRLGYQSALALSGLAMLFLTLNRLARVLGVNSPFGNTGTIMWITALFAIVAAFAAWRYRSLGCAILAGIAASGFALSFVDKVFNPHGVGTFRWVLLVLVLGFSAAAVAARGTPWADYSVPAVDVAGLMLVGLGATFAAAQIIAAINPLSAGSVAHAGFGWKLVLVLGSIALLAYAALERERGPGFIGLVAVLVTILVVAGRSGHPTLVGWPIVLLAAGVAAFALGLMPRGGGRPSPAARTAGEPPPPSPPPPAV